MRCSTGPVWCHITTAEPQTLRNRLKQSGPWALFAVSNLLTFVVCFSLMIILDNSTTHIGIVALTVKQKDRIEGQCQLGKCDNQFLDKHAMPFNSSRSTGRAWLSLDYKMRSYLWSSYVRARPTPLSNTKLVSLWDSRASIALGHWIADWRTIKFILVCLTNSDKSYTQEWCHPDHLKRC